MSDSPDPLPTSDSLEKWLRAEHTSRAPIADDGFSDRVLRALPPKSATRKLAVDYRPLLCFVGALTGLAMGAQETSLPTLDDASALYADWLSLTARVSQWMIEPTQLIALGAIALSLGILWLLDEQPRNER
jgi:hypothetical protein